MVRLERGDVAAALGLLVFKLAVSAWVLHLGFSHVSDDDYARVTIAQAFAHAPRLDPSGTSWLPFPFWLNGLAMMGLGRTLAVARGVAIATGVFGAWLVYGSLRASGVTRPVSWVSVALAMTAPWSAWLGVATVPEALTACLLVAGALSLNVRRHHGWGAAALLVASLSRYEAWPVAAVFAAGCLWSARAPPRRARAVDLVAAGVSLLGPVAWVLWNAHAHGDPLHFLARVAAYRQRLGGAGTWMLYPRAMGEAAPEVALLACFGGAAMLLDPTLRTRWAGPVAAVVALLTFLVLGELHDGAPTHHPERALVAVMWIATACGVDGMVSLARRVATPRIGGAVLVVGALAWGVLWTRRVADFPGQSPEDTRVTQVTLGESLRARDVAYVVMTPCAYEHFAVIAAFGAPERVEVLSGSASVEKQACPRIEER